MEEQRVPEEHRDIEVPNANEEFKSENEKENVDYNVPGMLNATVKRSQSTNIGSLVERIESNPRRRILENDLRPQHQSFVPFSEESKTLIKEAGNIELSEMINVAPQITMQRVLSVLQRWAHLLSMRTLLMREHYDAQAVCQGRS